MWRCSCRSSSVIGDLYNLALRLTGNEQDAKDVVQDSLLNAYLHLEQFEGRADLRTWLNRILVNCALDHLRSLRRRPDVNEPHPISDVVDTIASSSPDPERLVASADWRRHVTAAMTTIDSRSINSICSRRLALPGSCHSRCSAWRPSCFM